MNPKDRRVKVHQEEIERLLDLKSMVDHKETAWGYAEQYQKLGWVLQGVNPLDGIDLEVDAGEAPENSVICLSKTGLSGPKINMAVHTGKQSGLMVLEVVRGQGELILDQYGEWRAECIAALGAGREQHFYAWDPSPLFNSSSWQAISGIRWLGEGQVVPVPPSFDAEMQETWRWLCPPWEAPPQYPGQPLMKFLLQHLTRKAQPQPEVSLSWPEVSVPQPEVGLPQPEVGLPQPEIILPQPEVSLSWPEVSLSRPEVSLSWQEVYCLVAPYETLLQALSASYPSIWNYYQGIVDAAVAVGLNSPEVLLSLLWHAPRGKARQQPEIWDFLQKLVMESQDQVGAETPPENVPWEVYLGNFLALAKESSQSNSGQPASRPGPPCFLQRRQTKPPRLGESRRTPFSCRKTGAYLKKP